MSTLNFKAKGLLMMGCFLAASIESASALQGMTHGDNQPVEIDSITITESPQMPTLRGKKFSARRLENFFNQVMLETGIDTPTLANLARSSSLTKGFAFTVTGKDHKTYMVTFDQGRLVLHKQ